MIGDALANAMLDHVFGRGAYSPPTIYVGVSTADPGADGSALAEPTGGGYARAATAGATWADAEDGQIANAAVVTMPLAVSDWGLVSHVAIFDAAEGGNLLAWGPLDAAVSVSGGDWLQFNEGDLTITLE